MNDFNIDPAAINKYVSEQIIKSALGEELKKAIDKEIERLRSTTDSPVRVQVNLALGRAVNEYLETPEVKGKLMELVKNRLTDDFIQKMSETIKVGSW